MSLTKITRLPTGRLVSCFHWPHQLLRPSISPLTEPGRAGFHGEYRRPGQPKEEKFPWQKINFDFSKGLEGIKKNFALLRKEFSDRWVGPEGKPLLEHMLEQNRVIWEFKGPESLEQWTVSSDHEIGGKSKVHLKMGRTGQSCFLYGNLNSTPPRDGETRYSGYCSMRSRQPQVRWWCRGNRRRPAKISLGCQIYIQILINVPGFNTRFFSLRVPLTGKSTTTGPLSIRCTCACAATAAPGWSTLPRKPTSRTRRMTFTATSSTPGAGPTGRR